MKKTDKKILKTKWIDIYGNTHLLGSMEPRHLFYSTRLILKKINEIKHKQNTPFLTINPKLLKIYKNQYKDLKRALIIRGIRVPSNEIDSWTEEDKQNSMRLKINNIDMSYEIY